MKTRKLSFIKRIFVFFCCTVLLLSSVFASYGMTVYASETEWDDAAKACISIAGVICGLIFAPEITTGLIIGALLDTAYNSITIGKYIYENSDGTYTIDPEFIQAVMDAAEQLEAQGFSDSDVKRQGEGYLQTYKWTVSQSYMYNHPYKTTPESHHYTYIYSADNAGRVAGLNKIETSVASNGRSVKNFYWYVYRYDSIYTNLLLSGSGNYSGSIDGKSMSGSTSTSGFGSLDEWDGSQSSDKYNCSQSFGGNFPIFSSDDTLKTYLRTGQGYKDALNYRAQPLFRRHSSYTPTYAGGSITVNRTVVQNIASKIAEVDADDTKTDDEKIEILQKYILSGGSSDIGGGSGGGGDKDYDDNKDLPSGTELADANSWLKKIYLKVCQIFDKLSESVEGVSDSVHAKIQETLDEMLVQIKKLKHWTMADTAVNAADAVADWLDFLKGIFDDMENGAGNAVAAISSGMDGATSLLRTKFPFCIPWDVAFLVTFLAHEPETPVFKLPIHVESVGIDEYIEVDMSDFSGISTISRTILMLIYCYGLLNLTMKIIPMAKEGT